MAHRTAHHLPVHTDERESVDKRHGHGSCNIYIPENVPPVRSSGDGLRDSELHLPCRYATQNVLMHLIHLELHRCRQRNPEERHRHGQDNGAEP